MSTPTHPWTDDLPSRTEVDDDTVTELALCEDERVALLLREERDRLVGLARVHGDENATSPDALGHHRERGPGPHARLGQQDSYLFRPDRPPTPSFASNRRHLRALADMDSRQRVAPQA